MNSYLKSYNGAWIIRIENSYLKQQLFIISYLKTRNCLQKNDWPRH